LISGLRSALAVYADRRVAAVLLLGASGGLPLALTGATLSVRLTEDGLSLSAIGLFTLVGLPYALKLLWAPLIDRLSLPLLSARLGRRRAWGWLAQACLALALVALGLAQPREDLASVALLALLVSFCSASQDIVIDAWRVESLEAERAGAGAAVYVLGYRLGMLTSGAGALFLASVLPWSEVYLLMAALVGVGALAFVLGGEPKVPPRPPVLGPHRRGLAAVGAWLSDALVAPLADLTRRPAWVAVLLFVALFKLGDVLIGVMAMPFYLSLGFTKIDIATVTKVFGLIAAIVGGLIGGAVVQRWGVRRAVLGLGLLQMAANLMFVALALGGHDLALLTVTVALENLAGGMGTAAFVAYLSGLCTPAYTATQYALLSSLFAFSRDILGAGAGVLAQALGWPLYFLVATLAAVPALVLFVGWAGRREVFAAGRPAVAFSSDAT